MDTMVRHLQDVEAVEEGHLQCRQEAVDRRQLDEEVAAAQAAITVGTVVVIRIVAMVVAIVVVAVAADDGSVWDRPAGVVAAEVTTIVVRPVLHLRVEEVVGGDDSTKTVKNRNRTYGYVYLQVVG
jgi:uncharacterized membrane protein